MKVFAAISALVVPLTAAAGTAMSAQQQAGVSNWIETPTLKPLVAAGKLPPVFERLPRNPRVIDLPAEGRKNGQHGGRLRMLMAREKDIRMAVYYGYSRLVGYNEKLDIVPDILESYEVEENRIFTLRLRAGHRWSDGHPFTSEDFRYYWEDMANNKKLSRGGPHRYLLADGKPPRFEVIDEQTVRYTWDVPNPRFLPALAGTRALYIFAPSHYARQFHTKYADPEKLKEAVKEARVRNWAKLHKRMIQQYMPKNQQLPTLEAWQNSTKSPSTLYIFKRNPYFHRVDSAGRQLPYADELSLSIVSRELVPAKTGSGESDIQGRYLRFDDYTFLKAAERQKTIKVNLWERGVGAEVALFPNLTTTDTVWRNVMRDVRVRRAMSLAIDRNEINQVIFYGLANASANTVLPGCPLYSDKYAHSYTKFDIAEANRLLDAAGLDKRDAFGTRLLPDGRPANIIMEAPSGKPVLADVLELVKDSWAKTGLRLFVRTTQRDLFRKRVYAGDTIMAASTGLDNGLPNVEMSPEAFVPTSPEQYQWSAWGKHYWKRGKSGEAPDLPAAKELLELFDDWHQARDAAGRSKAWHRILAIHAENVFTIGIINSALQPIAIHPELENVPKKGIFTYVPGGYFGMYMPDTFWFSGKRAASVE